LLLPDSKPRQALEQALLKGRVLLSFATLAELYEVLGRKKFLRYIDEEDIRSFLAALTREAEWVEVNVRIAVCRDPKDDKFLELAVSGNATHIVTGDADLIALNPFRGIEILPPHRFL
jgi:putative PIN family toxin of toxin-antitoxin system